jgi:F-type H+-transporting ATPase subunit b
VINLDLTLVIQMVNFVVLLLILNRFLYKPVLNILDERKGRIQESEKNVRELGEETARQWEAYEKQLQEARLSATAERERLKGEGLEAERKLLDEVRTEAARAVEEARGQLQTEMTKAKDALRAQADGLAVDIAQKILGRSLQ